MSKPFTYIWAGTRAGVILALLILSLRPAMAQRCGPPPNPRTEAAALSRWCACMGGRYDYQTTSCYGARWRDYRRVAPYWHCTARAGNGATGWGRNQSQATAQHRAVSECLRRSRGQRCTIQLCGRDR